MISTGISRIAWVAAFTLCGVATAAEYAIEFQPRDAHFIAERVDNRAMLAAVLTLLRDYAGAPDVRFVLVGEISDACAAAIHCEARELLQRRIEAITAEVMAAPGGASLVAQLQWQSIPLASQPTHFEGLQLRLRSGQPAVLSDRCPYQLQVADPRLPPSLPDANEDKVREGLHWVSMRGLAAFPISNVASVRVRIPSAARQVFLVAKQRLDDREVLLSSGSSQAQWGAEQLDWKIGAAEVEIDNELHARDVGDVLLPWDDSPQKPSRDRASDICRIRFVLTH